MVARTFDSEARTLGVLGNLRSLTSYPSVIWQNRYMVHNFFVRELMSRFHGSMLGAWWMLVQPMFMFAVYYLIFGVMYARGPDGPSIEFALYLFSGVICFHALVEATSTCCQIVVANGNLVKKVAFPSEVLPVPAAMVSMVVYVVGALLTLVIGAVTGASLPGIELLFLPIVMALQFVLTLGLGLFLANANVFVRDVQQVWRIFATAWFFLSPVFWWPTMMEQTIENPTLTTLLFYGNPAYSLLSAQRIALGGEITDWGVIDFWGHVGVLGAWAAGALLIGYLTFIANKHKHADIV
ncbi:MAG: ABC transporter permease [Planctomycetes bacterium]|nr:ABC transporter permease [Planctomycetota bacterium]